MSQPARLEVDLGDLGRAASVLDDAGRALFARAEDLDVTVDAGASSGEVATVLASLSSIVAALGDRLGALSESTRTAASDFAGTDQLVAGGMDGLRMELGP